MVAMDSEPLYKGAEFGAKLGHLVAGGKNVPYAHPHVWQKEPAGIRKRIVAAPKGDFIDLVLSLASCFDGPYSVLYILAVPRKSAPGRYQLECTLTLTELRSMLEPFTEYFQGDARHHLWVYSQSSRGMLVYDLHNLIYAYGPLKAYIKVLEEAGMSKGKVELPFPHIHNYFPQFDEDEERLIQTYSWKRTDLLPGVDD